MSAADQCLAELAALVTAKDVDAPALAEGSVTTFLASTPGSPHDSALALAALQARFIQQPGASKTRADILDVLGDRIARLLDVDGGDRA